MTVIAASPAPTAIGAYLNSHVRAFTRAELTRLFNDRALRTAVAKSEATRVLAGIYAATVHAGSFHVRVHAASLRCGAPVSGAAALFEWGLLRRSPRVIEIAIGAEQRLRGPDWLVGRRTALEVPTTMRNGTVVVTPAYAIVSGFGRVDPNLRAEVVFGAIRRGLVGVQQVRNELNRQPKVKARRALERRLDAAELGAQSWLEERGLREVFRAKEFGAFIRQHEIVIEGNQFFLDMFEPVARLAVELDGDGTHDNPYDRLRDIRRDAMVATRGIQTIRLSRADLVERPDWCRWIVLQVLHARRNAA